jgi:hypothetical protein
MNTRNLSVAMRPWMLVILSALPAFGQIAQDRPELCGKPNERPPFPFNLSAVSTNAKTDLTVSLSGSTAKILMPTVRKVEEVCPLTGNRLLVFGDTGNGSYDAYLIAESTGVVLDSFIAFTPAVSPDQHWLAMRDWIIPQAELPATEQYLLYDLTKDAAGNRSFPWSDPRQVPRYGRTMYPVTPNRVPFENHGVREDQVHTFWGESFYWAGDSKSLVFADRTQGGLAMVLVQVGEKELTTLLHPVSADEVCGRLSDATISEPYGVPEIQATFYAPGSTPCTKVLTLHGDDFLPAKEEVYPPRKITQPAVRKK